MQEFLKSLQKETYVREIGKKDKPLMPKKTYKDDIVKLKFYVLQRMWEENPRS